ncbi:guanine nucleotide-binding protein G(I)/G(S)/G(O) subunit gamma-7 isoform X1 [Aotus nancymaae]|uniref:guanine nucleotide-binding protein G(I)/G(S)/G(O) subunit gamma-7 isoform X1 n=1 Tax=Aotus nancymaae TaxID=37293 RepID=UPI0030FE65CB
MPAEVSRGRGRGTAPRWCQGDWSGAWFRELGSGISVLWTAGPSIQGVQHAVIPGETEKGICPFHVGDLTGCPPCS